MAAARDADGVKRDGSAAPGWKGVGEGTDDMLPPGKSDAGSCLGGTEEQELSRQKASIHRSNGR